MRGKFASSYYAEPYKGWKERAKEFVQDLPLQAPEALRGRPCVVELVVKPTRPRTSKLSHPLPDVDNYAKAACDAITASEKWWLDDKQIIDLRTVKSWANPDDTPGIEVSITFL